MTTIGSGNGIRANGHSASPVADVLRLVASGENALDDLGTKIFFDRYAIKDMSNQQLGAGDLVIVCTDTASGQREIGCVAAIDGGRVKVELRDGETQEFKREHVVKPAETHPAQMMDRVARGIAAVEGEQADRWYEKFRWLLEGWKFVPAGRILTGAGTDQRLTYFNCFVLPHLPDSRGGIFERLNQMAEIMSRGGGVGVNISTLRPRFAHVKGVNGRSSGSVSWGALYSYVTGLVEQAGSRRGALMIILNCWHPDVVEFINSKRDMGKITNANISVAITDRFMDAVKRDDDWQLVFPDTADPDYDQAWDGNLDKWIAAGHQVNVHDTVKAREVWNAIIQSAWASAEPGVFFVDRANKMSNSWYYPSGYLQCTNPCVTRDTLIYTDKGLSRVGDLFESRQPIAVTVDGRFNRQETAMPASRVTYTGEKMVYRLQTREGYFLRATADHRVMTPLGWKELGSLRPGDRIHILNRRGGFGGEGSLDLGRTLGWLIGDGHFNLASGYAVLSFFGREKQELAHDFARAVNAIVRPSARPTRKYKSGVQQLKDRDEARVQSSRLLEIASLHGLVQHKHRVPEVVFNGTEDMQKGFLQALFTADGGFQGGREKGGRIGLASNSIELLEGVQQLLLNFGIASRIYHNRRCGHFTDFPDGNGGSKPYWCKAQHELTISRQNLSGFSNQIGFLLAYKQQALHDYVTRGKRGPYVENFTATVESVTEEGVEEVFDITEPTTHSFVANGIVVHNCGEQVLAGWSVCNLGAINLAKFVRGGEVDWETLGSALALAVRFLDDVIDATPYFFRENEEQQKSERRVGLNTMGLAEMMIRLGIRYGSDESVRFIDRLYEFIASEVYCASADIAAEKGAFPFFDAEKFLQSGFMQTMPVRVREEVRRKGVRNVTLLTQAPNGTTGSMCGTSTGIEPFYNWTYFRKSRLGKHEVEVPVMRAWREAHPGEPLPDYFVTAMDLAPEAHIKVQAAVQRWVDASISKTANLPASYTVEQTREIFELLYRTGCKGGTIYRDGSRDVQVLNLTDDKQAAPPAPPVAETVGAAKTARKERPRELAGWTFRVGIDGQYLYVTVNHDGTEIVEAFAAGPLSGGVGMLASKMLRSGCFTPQEIARSLNKITGTHTVVFNERIITSPEQFFAECLLIGDRRLKGLPDSAHAVQALSAQPAAAVDVTPSSGGRRCPQCGGPRLRRVEGCDSCPDCGHSKCS